MCLVMVTMITLIGNCNNIQICFAHQNGMTVSIDIFGVVILQMKTENLIFEK